MMYMKPPRGAYWLANAFVYYCDKIANTCHYIASALSQPGPKRPEDCTTKEELIAYAQSIQHREPSLAADLIAAANRTEKE